MEALPYGLARRQVLVNTVAHDDRWFVFNAYPCGESGEQLEIFLELGWINSAWVVFSLRL